MKKGQWLIGAGAIGIIGTFLGRVLGPSSIGLPFDLSVAFDGLAPQLAAGAILILVGLYIRKRAIIKSGSSHSIKQSEDQAMLESRGNAIGRLLATSAKEFANAYYNRLSSGLYSSSDSYSTDPTYISYDKCRTACLSCLSAFTCSIFIRQNEPELADLIRCTAFANYFVDEKCPSEDSIDDKLFKAMLEKYTAGYLVCLEHLSGKHAPQEFFKSLGSFLFINSHEIDPAIDAYDFDAYFSDTAKHLVSWNEGFLTKLRDLENNIKSKASESTPAENLARVSMNTGTPKKTALYVLGALGLLLLVSVVVFWMHNSKLHGQVLQLTAEKTELQAAVDALSKEHVSDVKELKRMRDEKIDQTLKQIRIADALRFYYDYAGVLDGDGRSYYHRYACNCPLLAAQDSFYIYNIEAMPSKSKPCPYCYSSSADLLIDNARMEH